MIYLATVHFATDKWIPIQMKYLKKYINEEFRVFACTPPPAEKYLEQFYFASEFEPEVKHSESHPSKLNYLGECILRTGSEDDLLIFIDGDAFPIAGFLPFIREKLKTYPLIAIRRDENNGDRQPHPSFCATTIGFWKKINGDWSRGYRWGDAQGDKITDVGGNLLFILNTGGYQWYPLLRTNKTNLHPLWFGIYADVIYHHGAGFRKPSCRIERVRYGYPKKRWRLLFMPPIIRHYFRIVLGKLGSSPLIFRDTEAYKESINLMDRVFSEIERNDEFYTMFMREEVSINVKEPKDASPSHVPGI